MEHVAEVQTDAGTWEVIPADAPVREAVVAPVVTDDADEPDPAPVADVAKPAEVTPAKVAKPRNDPEARIAQVVAKQKEAEREAARLKAELDAIRAPKPASEPAKAVAPPAAEKFPDYATYLQQHPDASLELWMDARDEWRDSRRDAQIKEQQSGADKERAFEEFAGSFGDRYGDEFAADLESGVLMKELFMVKPMSTLTKKDEAAIRAIPADQMVKVGTIQMPLREMVSLQCFLMDEVKAADHPKDVARYVSNPDNFQRFATLPPSAVIRELAKLQAGLSAAPVTGSAPKSKPVSQAEPPITPVRSSPHVSSAEEPGDDASDDEWYRWQQARSKRAKR